MKTSELTGAALDWAVAKCLDGKMSITDERGRWLVVFQPTTRGATGGGEPYPPMFFSPSTDWAQGGPIIEQSCIITSHNRGYDFDQPWRCALSIDPYNLFEGPTPLIAAMRCYVASKLGDDIEIPEELQ